MSTSKYDKFFSGKSGSAAKAKSSMSKLKSQGKSMSKPMGGKSSSKRGC